jgi:D-arabinose 1-dehydrogenase-like Zn-dependent alcohol dehydrogenase
MKAVLCTRHGPPEALTVAELPSPSPAREQVVIEVHASSVNFPDKLIIQDRYQFKPALPFSPGAEVAGIVKAVGDGMACGKTLFCGLPMFHVNAVLVTGCCRSRAGAHVILGTPQGYRGEGVIARFREMVERHRINFFSGVPTVYAALM